MYTMVKKERVVLLIFRLMPLVESRGMEGHYEKKNGSISTKIAGGVKRNVISRRSWKTCTWKRYKVILKKCGVGKKIKIVKLG